MICPADPSFIANRTLPETGAKITAIARRSEKSTTFTSGPIIELGWGFYGIFGIDMSSDDPEEVRNVFFDKS